MADYKILTIPFARDATSDLVYDIPDDPSAVTPQSASWKNGFPYVTMIPLVAGGIPPQGQDFNGVIKDITEHIVHQNMGGMYVFDDDVVAAGGYPKGAVLQADGGLSSYVSLIDNNTDNFNSAPSVNWAPYAGEALNNLIRNGMMFTEVDALTSDIGPIIVRDMDGTAWTWVDTPYFNGYRSARCGHWEDGWTPNPLPFQIPATGGVWSENDPKHKRVIARYRESGLVVPVGDWVKGQNMIADLGSGDWKAPDLQDMFKRMSGTDVDTANARLLGKHEDDAIQGHWHEQWHRQDKTFYSGGNAGYSHVSANQSQHQSGDGYTREVISGSQFGVPRVSSETRPTNTRVSPFIYV